MRILKNIVLLISVSTLLGSCGKPAGNVESSGTGTPEISAVSNEKLLEGTADTSGWYMYGGSYESWRYSPIKKINKRNVSKLRPEWIFQTGTSGQMGGSPVVADGVMYLTAPYNNVWALNAKTGETLWHYEKDLPSDLRLCCGPANRGVAISGKNIFMATLDAYLLALDRVTGEVVWEVKLEEYKTGYSTTNAPIIIDDLVITGISGGEYGARGFIDAYEVSSGKHVWRRYTVPSAGEPGSETWAGDSWKTGGGPSWATGTYDAKTKLLYWPTGNPSPDWNGDSRKGDNLFTNSVLALDPATGDMKWYFQFTPHDVWDYDSTNGIVLTDLEIKGEKKRVLLQPNRNGYVYVLDATDGQYIHAFQYTDRLNWAKGLDENGRPIVDPDYLPVEGGSERFSCPGPIGGHNGAWSYSFNPVKKLMFVPSIESCSKMIKEEANYKAGDPFWGGGQLENEQETGKAYGLLLGIDPANKEIRWKYKDKYPLVAGALATAGDVVFTGNQEGFALAFDSSSGDMLWKFQMGSSVRGQPITWEDSGTQYVAIPSGGGGLAVEMVGEPPLVTRGGALTVFAIPR